MSKNLYNLKKMPDIPPELLELFTEIIDSGIEIFANENGLELEETIELFEKKLQNITFKIFDAQDPNAVSPKERSDLFLEQGLTICKVDPKQPNKPAEKTLYLQKYLFEDPKQLKSTFIHEIFHGVLSEDALTFRNGQYVYKMGCSENIFENGSFIDSKGHMLHEILVARMQKNFCKKEGIPFIEKGLLASYYAPGLKILQKFEKLTNSKMHPNETFDTLRLRYGSDFEILSDLLDIGDYPKCGEFISQLQCQKSPIARFKHSLLNFAKQSSERIKKIFKPKNELLTLGESSLEFSETGHSSNTVSNVEPLSPHQKFEQVLSNNGELKSFKTTQIQPPSTSASHQPPTHLHSNPDLDEMTL